MTRSKKLIISFELLAFVTAFPLFIELLSGGILGLNIAIRWTLGIIAIVAFIACCAVLMKEFKKE